MSRRLSTTAELQNQLTDLKAEILELSGAIASAANATANNAKPFLDDVNSRVNDAADASWKRGKALAGAAQENPGLTTTIAVAAGLFGLAVAWFATSSSQSSRLHS